MADDENPLEMLVNLEGAPAWLIAKVDQRVARIEAEAGAGINAFSKDGVNPLVVTPLTEPDEFGVSMNRWERTCDNCGKFIPESESLFFTGNTARKLKHGQYVVITFGACETCVDL